MGVPIAAQEHSISGERPLTDALCTVGLQTIMHQMHQIPQWPTEVTQVAGDSSGCISGLTTNRSPGAPAQLGR